MKTNEYFELDENEYHARPEISSHGLMSCLKSAAHYKAKKEKSNEASPAMFFGRMAHLMALEPTRFDELVMIAPRFDKRTKQGKEDAAAFEAGAPGKLLCTPEEYAQLQAMRAVLLESGTWRHLASSLLFSERVAFVQPWENTEEMARFRPDGVGQGFILEYKTTRDAGPSEFAAEIARYKYDMQAAFYVHCHQLVTGERPRFVFAAQEKEAPFAVAFYEADEEMLATGWELCTQAASNYLRALDSDIFEAYPDEVQTIKLPRWHVNKTFDSFGE